MIRPWLTEMPSQQLAAFLIGGIAIADLPEAAIKRMLSVAFGSTDCVAAHP